MDAVLGPSHWVHLKTKAYKRGEAFVNALNAVRPPGETKLDIPEAISCEYYAASSWNANAGRLDEVIREILPILDHWISESCSQHLVSKYSIKAYPNVNVFDEEEEEEEEEAEEVKAPPKEVEPEVVHLDVPAVSKKDKLRIGTSSSAKASPSPPKIKQALATLSRN